MPGAGAVHLIRTVSSVLWHDSDDASRFADCEY